MAACGRVWGTRAPSGDSAPPLGGIGPHPNPFFLNSRWLLAAPHHSDPLGSRKDEIPATGPGRDKSALSLCREPAAARLRDLRGRNARTFDVRVPPRRDGVVLIACPAGLGDRSSDSVSETPPPPPAAAARQLSTCRAPLPAGERCGRSRRRTERFSFAQRHYAHPTGRVGTLGH